jgi:ssDNA-specific exonuclease RecJ
MKFNITDDKHITDILNKASEVFNIPLPALLGKSRKQEINLARMCIANICRVENKIHYNSIAEVLQKDRTSIYYYEKQHEALYQSWAVYRDKFNMLYNNIYKNEKRKITRSEITKLLKKHNLVQENGAVTLYIRSGRVNYKFRTTYSGMCENSEKIKNIMSDFDISIDIKI